METIKIQISEVEGMSVKIPTEFTAHSFNKFYEQMQNIAKSMPNNHLVVSDITPERLKISNWPDKEVCFKMLKIWESEGKEKMIEWIKENLNIEFDPVEKSKLSSLMAGIRSKYKKELLK
ncbi:hypothetical protein LCGC14_0442070 [marine sediment metagenome]|uniref:Uncharacterized protein n=1 Tax=marine sediment metagenome TaxID=412755 RepID=A0A0F9T3F8_9ZZZZ